MLAADPCGRANPSLVSAAQRAGGVGVLDVADGSSLAGLLVELERRRVDSFWARPGAGLAPDDLASVDAALVPTVVVAVDPLASAERVSALVGSWVTPSRRVVAQVTSSEHARWAVDAGAEGIVASGCEAGGPVGSTEAFVLLQQVLDLGVPVWVRGGIGRHTAAAVVAGGGAGVLLDVQLGLLKEGGLGPQARRALEAMDGSETRVVGGHRFYTRPDLPAATLADDAAAADVAALIGADPRSQLLPFGQDGGFAVGLAAEHATVGGVVQAINASIAHHLTAAAAAPPLAPGAGVAGPHGTRYPIAQGPMTRVSDRAAFAAAVADGGGLPFLALALLPAAEVRDLLVETAELLGDRPWGVGILGFVPAELRAEQLEVVHEIAPPVALIAGGRPSQAAPLEAAGIGTYLHVPSPGLLDRFLKDGARKFVFEGRECGGHVGPRSSFALWDAQIEQLMAVADPENLQVLLAGGIHDARSAAMAAAAMAPLAARGAKVGVLMGTAYLFTEEAVSGGAIEPAFQDVAVTCETTVLLETAPGHATRCVETDFVRAFAARRDELIAEGVEANARWAELETLNLGRLRIASKGLVRGDSGLEAVDEHRQRSEGMYMIGEVATMRHQVTTIAALHAEVSEGSAAIATAGSGSPVTVREPERVEPLNIAIVGMDSFFPGAVGAEEFWAEIVAGTDAITEVLPERWDVDRYYDADAFTRDAGRKTPSKWGGFIRRIGFDPLAYGIPPASLAAIEPVQLLSLEVAARALADAGYATRPFDRERASVVFGSESGNELGGAYGVRAFLPQLFGEIPEALESWLPSLTEDSFPGVLANVIAGRIANRLDLGGVNYTVDAACASSLAALDAACKELRTGQSDLVLAGGADLHNGLNDYLMFASVHALSPSGRCRTFDASADGIALGEGVACVVLKRLADAERDGDRIYAVIDAVAGSSDGRSLGLTAPRKEGQQRAVHRALARSGIEAAEISLVEAHGTGTVVGDRTEMATLTEVFAEAGVQPGAAVLGSVKSQIGHTKCAAGLAGLMKVAKAIHHAVLPPTINLVDPNPYYDAATSPFRFLDQARPWAEETRRAGVSAFGFGGTNFHALLSSYDAGDRPAHGLEHWPAELFLFRAASAEAAQPVLSELSATVAAILATDPDGQRHRLRDLAAAVSLAGTGPVQVAIVAASPADLHAQLEQARTGAPDSRAGTFVAGGTAGASDAGDAPQVAFLYPGQGSQRPGMLSDLFVTFGGLDDILRAGERWTGQLFPPAAFTREERNAQAEAITATDVAQPTLGMASLALTRILGRLGIAPAMAGGHSYGELAALAAAGSFDDATLLELSAARGGAILDAIERSGGDPGTMAALNLSREELGERLAPWPDLVLANHNGPRQAVISGPTASVTEAVAALEADGVKAKLLPVACAFHSPVIAEAGRLLAERLAEHAVHAPSFPVWSNVTAEPYPAGDASSVARLLTEQVTEGVRFVDQIESMYAAGARVFVEAGPGRVLTQQVSKILGDRPHAMVACDVAGEPGLRRLLLAVAELAALGVPVDPTALFEGRSTAVDLRSLPVAAPNWTIDGAFVRTADGTPLPNSLQPADLLPTLDFGGLSMTTGSDDASGVVLEYLRSVRQIVAAERDVMMRYLGSAVPATANFDDFAGYIEGAAQPAVGASAPGETTPALAGASNGSTSVNGNGSASAAGAADRPVLSGADLMREVQAIVSERTGYPVEMLDPDLDLEADLSIDSIKRIEIVGELAERIGLAGLDESAVDEELVEELAQHKSLRAIVDWIEGMTTGEPSPDSAAASAVAHAAHEPEHHLPVPVSSQRFVVLAEPLAPPVALGDLHGSSIGVVAGHQNLTAAVVAALEGRGASVSVLERAEPSAVRSEQLAALNGVVDLSTTAGDPSADARTVFADLQPALLGTARRAVAVSVPLHPDGTPTGVAGLMRSLARERHDALIRALEIEPVDLRDDPTPFAEVVVDELMDVYAPAAVSWAGGQRTARVVGEAQDLADPVPLDLDAEAVVVVTGGARGITARVARGLAEASPCHLVLVGRSEEPAEEDPRTASATDRSELRRVLLEIGELHTPAEIESACNRIEADREIRSTLDALREACPSVEYAAADVRSPEFAALLDDVRTRHGRLDGVIHGAGVLDDRFIRDKSLDGFDRVYGTKVDGARAILDRQEGLRFVALFGSVSGVFGNRGQVDYSSANDALDTLARAHDGRHGCHVVSVDWGPWGGGGMVSAELEREYARRGIGLVDPDEGVRALLHELTATDGRSQVVVMRGTPEAFAPPPDHTLVAEDLVGGFTTGD
ncbi:MAG: KR domain-containing protein [Acidimicrobiales bacterium]|nr:KR domain-containing protein [Acidimicrobiales bacterium]